jgi:hypothetical protein
VQVIAEQPSDGLIAVAGRIGSSEGTSVLGKQAFSDQAIRGLTWPDANSR